MREPVCLIIPPSGFLLDERVFMSLGILRVAAALEQQHISVEVLDLSGVSNYQEAAVDHALATSASVFGFTATTPQLPAAVAIARGIRSVRADARLILGGPHATVVHAAHQNGCVRADKALADIARVFDVLVAGDGERAIFEALRDDAPRIIDADNPKHPSGLFLTGEQLEAFPFPARHLVDVASYHYTIDGERALSLIAQLGCPFGCLFCSGRTSPTFRRIRMRSSANVVQEMVHLFTTYGVKGFMFYDDELNVNPRLTELMQRIVVEQHTLGVQWRLRGFIKAELFTDTQAQAMYEAGFRWILVGFESGSSRILHNIGKGATRQDNERCLRIARAHGLKVKALMSLGNAGESPETVRDTEEWLLRVRPDEFDLSVITIYPGTPYFDRAVAHDNVPGVWVYTHPAGDRLYQHDIDYTSVAEYFKGRPGDYRAFVYTDHLSPKDLVYERDRIESSVRSKLGIPFNPSIATLSYEHSMGQQGRLPAWMLKKTLSRT